jgi:hypothetical protein
MANQVTLTFAGETKGVEDAFGRVGGAAKDMDSTVRNSSGGFDRATERFDTMDTRAMGFRDTLTGLEDGTKGIKQAAAGDWGFETLLLIGFGIGDLASGMVNFLIPALKGTRLAQLGLNFAFLTSPLTWIILGIVALIAVIVLIATKTDWFSKAWRASWNFIKNAASSAWNWIKNAASNAWEFLRGIPGKIGSAFGRVASLISSPFRSAFNMVARAWNNTVGRLSFTFPSWIPGIGGNSISVPQLPTFHAGGVIPGVRGEAVPFLGLAGERVSGPAGSGGSGEQWIRVDLGELGEALLEPIAKAVSRKGGRVSALGVKVVNGAVRV